MLTVCGLVLAVTALLAGITGSWSPCGLSSIETIGSGLGRRPSARTRAVTLLIFSLGAVAGGAITFTAAAGLGAALQLDGQPQMLGLAAAAVALGAGVADLRVWPVAPQIRHQVPERIRHRLPLSATGGLYGLLLGLGFVTYLLTYAMWALLLGCLLLATPPLGLAVGIAFGLGRALPVLLLAGRYDRPAAEAFIAEMETGPLLRGMRRIDGVALLVCAIALVPTAHAGAAARTASGADPSVAEPAIAFTNAAGDGILRRGNGETLALPGRDPALGGEWIAWRARDEVTVAARDDLTAVAVFPIRHVDALAVGDLLAYRTTDRRGASAIGVRRLDGSGARTVTRVRSPLSLSPPSVAGRTVVYAVNAPTGSRLLAAAPGRQPRPVRVAGPWQSVGNPAVRGGALLYVHNDYCGQRLRLGALDGPIDGSRDRTLLRLRAPAERDTGHERGYVDAYHEAGLCPTTPYAPVTGTLWTTALSRRRALVTVVPARRPAASFVLTVRR
jgi:hypothetical protein